MGAGLRTHPQSLTKEDKARGLVDMKCTVTLLCEFDCADVAIEYITKTR
jgi:NAD-dependent dihydropyrimidine dehydrogenase PreA subunit